MMSCMKLLIARHQSHGPWDTKKHATAPGYLLVPLLARSDGSLLERNLNKYVPVRLVLTLYLNFLSRY